MAIKLFTPFVSEEAIQNVNRVLRSGYLAEGEEVKLFEQELEQELGIENIVTVNSGTSALELAYRLANIHEGDEVITPVLTCTATNLPLKRTGASIVFADIDEDLNINIQDVKNKITKRTKAIVFVHFGGNNRGLSDLVAICRERGITLIEDAAQAISSDYWAKGDYTAVSLQAIKTITSGDGGLLITKSNEDYAKAKRLRWFGYDREEKHKVGDTDLVEAGYKFHMNNINAALGRGNLLYLKELKKHQEKLAKIYKSYGLFAYSWLAGGFTDNYDALKARMADNGIEIGQHHYRNDKYTVFGGRKELPIMDRLENKYYFVPYHYEVTEEQAHIIGKLCQK